ncbi:MAG: tetratricopeptide repeat protein [Acidobacteriota bacterium]
MRKSRSLLIALAPILAFALDFQAEKPAANPAAPALPDAPLSIPAAEPVKPETLTPEKRADIFMARKMYREAIEQYREMPQDAVILNKIGIAYHQMMDLQTARRYYERAIKANPKYSEAVNNLGTVYYARKNYGRAVRQYQKALKLTPASASIYSNLGTAYFARKKYKEAFEAYQEALKLDPEVFEHRSSYGVLLQERTVEERSRFHFYLAKVYAKSGMNDRALTYIRKALEEGFKEKNKFLEDPEFAGLKDNAEFQQLMAQEQRVL